ncbi:group II intron maturase-specific domain-containing protein [Frankia sp. Cj5]|uniref:group II intron maturase-specific domain-containing protein n=1 Tax=Frankia sp. Cj5 TaxID=2880978 RepID=UPI001EF480FD|nr:group II intron maturase-specific domain-containing protein [Frankia sp. Cj5]
MSPLMANVYLHRIDRAWDHGRDGTLVRYIDDLVVMCESRQQAERALARITAILAELGLEPKAAKTRIVHLTEGGEGVDFLGFHHRLVRARGRTGAKRVIFLARWPSRKAAQHARDRIRELTARSRLLVPVDIVVREVNAFLRGWAGYFRYGNSARMFDKMQTYALHRLAIFVAHRHKRSRAWGWRVVAYASPDHFGLLNLDGTVRAPRPNRPWRSPNAGGERRR